MIKSKIEIRNFHLSDARSLMDIFYNTIHKINIKDYSLEQVNAWASKSDMDLEKWKNRFINSRPIIALIEGQIVGFAEFKNDGYIDCFFVHHEWIGKGVGKALMKEIFIRAKKNNIKRIFVDVSITAKPFFKKFGFSSIKKQIITRKGVELTNFPMEKID